MENPEIDTIRQTLFRKIEPIGPDNPGWHEFPGIMCFWRAAVFHSRNDERILVVSRISETGAVDGLSLSNVDTNQIGHMTIDQNDSFVTAQHDIDAQVEMGLWVGDAASLELLKEFTEVVLATE